MFFGHHAQTLLSTTGDFRHAAIIALSSDPIHAEGTQAVLQFLAALDGVAESLTEDRERFWMRLHSTPKRMP